jgi:hypothetical protein
MSYYAVVIDKQLARMNRADIPARHIEAYLRLRHGTLDHLDGRAFNKGVRLAVSEIDQDGAVMAEDVAKSYGLRP